MPKVDIFRPSNRFLVHFNQSIRVVVQVQFANLVQILPVLTKNGSTKATCSSERLQSLLN